MWLRSTAPSCILCELFVHWAPGKWLITTDRQTGKEREIWTCCSTSHGILFLAQANKFSCGKIKLVGRNSALWKIKRNIPKHISCPAFLISPLHRQPSLINSLHSKVNLRQYVKYMLQSAFSTQWWLSLRLWQLHNKTYDLTTRKIKPKNTTT